MPDPTLIASTPQRDMLRNENQLFAYGAVLRPWIIGGTVSEVIAEPEPDQPGGASTPAALFGSDLILWHKATTGVYTDAGTTIATNGQTVQQWNDQSGNSDHVSQSTSGRRPTYLSNAHGGKPGLQFSLIFPDVGTSKYLKTADDAIPLGTTEISVFTVLLITQDISGNNIAVSLASSNDTRDYYPESIRAVYKVGSSSPSLGTVRNTPFTFAPILFGTPYRAGCICEPSIGNFYLNGVATSPATDLLGSFGSLMTAYYGFGKGASAIDYFSGTLFEVVVVKRSITVGELASLDEYFRDMWGFW